MAEPLRRVGEQTVALHTSFPYHTKFVEGDSLICLGSNLLPRSVSVNEKGQTAAKCHECPRLFKFLPKTGQWF